MKNFCALILSLTVLVLAAGCQSNQTRVAEGTVIGTILGAGAGYVIGKQSGHGGEGAGIGAAVGALGGAAIGAQVEKPGQTAAGQTTSGGANPSQMSIQQIIDMTKQGVNEAVIVDRIRLSNSKFTLTAEDVTYLQQQGVSQAVISAMQGG